MGNALTVDVADPIVSDDPLLNEYKAATLDDFRDAKENFETLQGTLGDKMNVNPEEFDDIFSLICQDSLEHFALFDSWEVGKVDVTEVFAVIIVYCNATMEEKVPFLFDLFDFDHSKMISQDELVLLMLCTTRGLCKVVGKPRPATDSLEALATDAFSRIDRDQNGKISLDELTEWIVHERTVELSTAFLNFAEPEKDKLKFQCSEDVCEELIQRYCPAAGKYEIDFLLQKMKKSMKNTRSLVKYGESNVSDNAISMDAFFFVLSPFIAFLAADDDGEHSINIKELKILLWLMFGSEPSSKMVENFKNALDSNHDDSLNAMEWVSYALETKEQTGSQSIVNQIHLLFATSDVNGDAILTLPELQRGLISIFTDHLEPVNTPSKPVKSVETRRQAQFSTISSLATDLVKEIMGELDANDTRRIEWYEFRQHLEYLDRRVMEIKTYIQTHVLG
ncbi:EF-hand domain pair [Phytophthora infestans]|uniref:EF-hand domain pair n=1 Tax=Phytophthora infestans TaxID=4787 RepID=A0A833RY63_PHYIN|nr:EF-hand domain pair [Phytophthora infestans]